MRASKNIWAGVINAIMLEAIMFALVWWVVQNVRW